LLKRVANDKRERKRGTRTRVVVVSFVIVFRKSEGNEEKSMFGRR
jgi:hypothetical protein